MEKLFKNCIQCDEKGYIMKMTQHLCDKYIHNECLANIYKENNPNLGYDVVTKCKHCNEEFFKEQIELAYGIQKIEDERNKINMSYIRREDQQIRQQWKKQAEERSFDCQICFGEKININKECRTLDNCLHQFCESCLKEHILNSYLEGQVDCPLCAEIPVEERKFPDPQISKDKPHDPNNISISVPIIQDLLNKHEFEKLQTRWMNILYIEEENKKNKLIKVVLCPGFKKIVDQSKLQKNKIKRLGKQKQNNDESVTKLEKNDNKVEEEEKKENLEEEKQQNDDQDNKQNLEIVSKDIFKKKLSFGINKLGFEIQQCEAIYEYETTQQMNKDKTLKPITISCVSCKLDFCPEKIQLYDGEQNNNIKGQVPKFKSSQEENFDFLICQKLNIKEHQKNKQNDDSNQQTLGLYQQQYQDYLFQSLSPRTAQQLNELRLNQETQFDEDIFQQLNNQLDIINETHKNQQYNFDEEESQIIEQLNNQQKNIEDIKIEAQQTPKILINKKEIKVGKDSFYEIIEKQAKDFQNPKILENGMIKHFPKIDYYTPGIDIFDKYKKAFQQIKKRINKFNIKLDIEQILNKNSITKKPQKQEFYIQSDLYDQIIYEEKLQELIKKGEEKEKRRQKKLEELGDLANYYTSSSSDNEDSDQINIKNENKLKQIEEFEQNPLDIPDKDIIFITQKQQQINQKKQEQINKNQKKMKQKSFISKQAKQLDNLIQGLDQEIGDFEFE
ncbi:hypothetical protein PPERSA_08217 [Pseudocohnilembus persalinus]|uniref:RING-type domain-containing protein n=1 Tax=Pseudocohnilembus persalinus TaxID=266149 RepID=A0A0V0QG09_PSEPJ|nr:hypothetical protein PPERSA_08217 [Pseudocohnilembus persalinus]|eukprot:KRX01116.1 hypothetical protein PPERSA_08217 [Pseudocohnilembus persalinus]